MSNLCFLNTFSSLHMSNCYWKVRVFEPFFFFLGIFSRDIALTLSLLGFVAAPEDNDDVVLAIDWDLVDTHAERVKNSKTRIPIEPECLRWTPLVMVIANPYKPPPPIEDKPVRSQKMFYLIPLITFFYSYLWINDCWIMRFPEVSL